LRQVLHARLQPRAGYGFRRSAHAATASGGPALSQDTQLIADVSYGSFRREHAPYKYQKHTVYVSGKAAQSFYSADLPSTYTVIIEGTDMNGNFGYSRQKIKIKK
jgi:hypothetical protein